LNDGIGSSVSFETGFGAGFVTEIGTAVGVSVAAAAGGALGVFDEADDCVVLAGDGGLLVSSLVGSDAGTVAMAEAGDGDGAAGADTGVDGGAGVAVGVAVGDEGVSGLMVNGGIGVDGVVAGDGEVDEAGATGVTDEDSDGCIDVILRGDDVHLAGPSTVCIPTSPDVGETIGIRFDPGVAAGVLRFNPAEVRDLAAPLRDVVGAVRAAEVARVLRALRSFGTAPGADLLTSPADCWAGLVRRAAAAGAGAAQVAGEIGWSTRHLRRRMLATFGYGYGALVRVAPSSDGLPEVGHGRGVGDLGLGGGNV